VPETVLIVDDDPNVRKTLETLLRTVLETEVVAVESAHAALGWLLSHTVDLVITDLCMPGMSGADLIRQMRRDGNTTPVIIVSGHLSSFESRVAWSSMGVASVLEKPFGMHELIDAVVPLLPSRRGAA
jgi:DNA-binding NtrC family response regulator